MDLVLLRKVNHRNVELHDNQPGETIGVLRKDGTYTYVRWLGFISKNDAVASGGRPVKLQVSRIGRKDGWHTRWRDVEPGRHVKGCLTPGGVFAVYDADVFVV